MQWSAALEHQVDVRAVASRSVAAAARRNLRRAASEFSVEERLLVASALLQSASYELLNRSVAPKTVGFLLLVARIEALAQEVERL